MSLVLGHATPVARVAHRCDVCSGIIGIGDRYVRQRNVQDGEAFTWKGHALCSAAYMKAARDGGCVLAYEEYPDPDSEVMPLVRAFFDTVTAALHASSPVGVPSEPTAELPTPPGSEPDRG